MGSDISIMQRLLPDIDDVVADNRDYLTYIFKYVRWFVINELAMRGHNEHDDEDEQELRQGNWKSFITLQLETNADFKDIHIKMKQKRFATDYTSKTIVNEIIRVMASECRLKIYEEIKKTGCFSALIDESKDKGKREELAFAVRYYFEGRVIERFVALVMLTEFDAESITTATKKMIDNVQNNSDSAVMISLGADGASVMSGEFSGVAQRLRSTYFAWLLYIHCTAHRLNLVVNDLIKSSIVATDVMSFINSLYVLLNLAKVRSVYEQLFKEMNPKAQIKHITQQIEIRWACKFQGVDLIVNHVLVVVGTLVRVVNADKGSFDPKHVETAAGLYHKLLSGTLIVSLVTQQSYFGKLYYLSMKLQAERINWTDVMYEMKRTRRLFESITDDSILNTAQELCVKLNIDLSFTLPIHNTRSATATTAQPDRVNQTVKTLNQYIKQTLAKEFDVRFNDELMDVMCNLCTFDAGDPDYMDDNMLENFADHFSCIEINKSLLKMEIEMTKEDFENGIPINPDRATYLMKLITVKNTIATSTASVERAFSSMNRVCTKLRSTIIPERLSDLLCLSLNRDITSKQDVNKLIDIWAAMKNRRVLLHT